MFDYIYIIFKFIFHLNFNRKEMNTEKELKNEHEQNDELKQLSEIKREENIQK